MKKKIILGLLVVLSLSLVACGQGNDSEKTINSPKANINHSDNSTEGSEMASGENESSKNTVDSKSENTEENTKDEVNEKDYYKLIKEAWQKQKDYIDSVNDPKVKQSLQTTNSAAIFKCNELLLKYPEDADSINSSLNKVLNGEDF